MYTQLEQRHSPRPPVNLGTLQRMKAEGEKIAWLTAYDASFAMLVDMAGVDVVLVGDSLGMVIQGHETTVPVFVRLPRERYTGPFPLRFVVRDPATGAEREVEGRFLGP